MYEAIKFTRNRRGWSVLHIGVLSIAIHLLGCANRVEQTSPSSTGTPLIAPTILTQPADQSVPMGVTATYMVAATGSSPSYQWSKNGLAISGATAATYKTAATAFADGGSSYTVVVSNSIGSATSAAATLTVTARAPAAGDLRFQQVDSPATVNGYNDGPVGVSSAVGGPIGAWGFGYSIGTPLYIYPIACGPPAPVTYGWTCTWLFQQYYLPGQLDVLGLYTGYGADYFTNFPADLQTTTMAPFPGKSAPAAPNSVITSLDLEPANDLFAISFIQSSQGGGFDRSQQTVARVDFQAAATQEGAHSRVITAVSYNAGKVVYFSYGWKPDTSTVYDVQVAAATAETMATVASSLAAQGYIMTAIGGTDSTDNYLIVGTRVQGDTMPRPFAVVPQGVQIIAMMQQGMRSSASSCHQLVAPSHT